MTDMEREGWMKSGRTARGFMLKEFTDFYGHECSIQKSSLAGIDCIWFGIDDPNPQIMARDAVRLGLKPVEGGEKDNGWVPFAIPEEVSINTRMHLTRGQVAKLLPSLIRFVITGRLK